MFVTLSHWFLSHTSSEGRMRGALCAEVLLCDENAPWLLARVFWPHVSFPARHAIDESGWLIWEVSFGKGKWVNALDIQGVLAEYSQLGLTDPMQLYFQLKKWVTVVIAS